MPPLTLNLAGPAYIARLNGRVVEDRDVIVSH